MKIKKILAISVITAIFCTIFSNISFAKTATVNTDTLRLRKEPSTSSTTLELLDLGDKLEVIEEDGEWIKVKVDGVTGYVSAQYVKINEGSSLTNTTKSNKINTTTNTTKSSTTNTTTNTMATDTVANTATNTEVSNTQKNTEVQNTTSNEQTPQVSELGKAEITLKTGTDIYILPLINSTKILKTKTDTKADIIDRAGSWYYIQTNEVNGWVRITK